MTVNDRDTITSYTNNMIGSGHYCYCGHELTWDEYHDLVNKNKGSFCFHKKTASNY